MATEIKTASRSEIEREAREFLATAGRPEGSPPRQVPDEIVSEEVKLTIRQMKAVGFTIIED